MLRRRSVRLRIVVLVLVPVIALIALYGVILSLTVGSLLSFRQGARVGDEVTTPVSSAQLQMSLERALALQYIADPSHARLVKLLSQEPKSDDAIRTFLAAKAAAQKHAGPGELRAMHAWAGDLAALHGLRTSVVSLGLSRPATAAAYSALVAGGNNVISQAILPLLDSPGVVQANDLVTLDESLQSVAEESDLFSSDLTARSYPAADQRLINQLIVQRRELRDQGMTGLDRSYQTYFKNDISPVTSATLARFENQIAFGPHRALQIPEQDWVATNTGYDVSFRKALGSAALALQNVGVSKGRGLLLRLLLVGGLGLLAIVAAIVIAIIISRTLLQQITDLRRSAFALSSQQLPAIMARLRAGEEIDVGVDTPQLEAGTNEIGQLQQAFNVAARTAIGAAVDEVALRRGVNDVFRNLARRNQSLLTRQLELLDAMERRVHDPEELADLFRVDHLTTRMRRHAEGLLIVAGGSSGRVWRDPVPIVDVMRAAVAEIEDYTRIRVTSRTSASLAGHAVADIIHLLAEIVENATTFSPANTPVRIESDRVAKGLIVEIEDRGLGMSEAQIAEINVKLSDPPMLDLSGSEQLGLFIAGQLARRHEIRITMRGSAYGGIAAVVLIPSALVVEAGYGDPISAIGIRELGGRPVPQLPASAQQQPAAAAAAISSPAPGYDLGTGYLVDLESAATAVTTTVTQIGSAYRDRGTGSDLADRPLASDLRAPVSDQGAGTVPPGTVPPGTVSPDAVSPGMGGDLARRMPADAGGPAGYNPPSYSSAEFRIPGLDQTAGRAIEPDWSGPPAPGNGVAAEPPMLVLGPLTNPSGSAAEYGVVADDPAKPETDFGPVTDFGPARELGEADQSTDAEIADPPTEWPAWSSHFPGNQPSAVPAADPPSSQHAPASGSNGGPDADATRAVPSWLNLPVSAPRDSAGTPPEGDLEAQALLPKRQPRTPSLSLGSDVLSSDSFDPPLTNGEREVQPDQDAAGPPELDGLPMRVRQANLAPQLRDQSAARRAEQYVAAPEMPIAGTSVFATGSAQEPVAAAPYAPSSGGPSPEAAMNLMSALQRGWERGRSQAEHLTDESGEDQS